MQALVFMLLLWKKGCKTQQHEPLEKHSKAKESKMIEELYLWGCQTNEAGKCGWKKVDASDKIKIEV